MVMATGLPQGQRVNPRFTLEVTPGLSIANAIANADALGGEWTILVYPGTYNEGDLTPNGGANITIKGMGEGRVTIAPTVAPAIAVIVSAHTLNIEDIIVTAPTNAFPAVRVTAGTFEATSCELNGVLGGAIHDAVQQVGGTVVLHDCQVPVGDIDLRDAPCTLTFTDCDVNGTLDTAGAGVLMTVTVGHCDFHDQAINLAATGACVYEFESCNHLGTITDASLGAGAVNGHLCRCHVTSAGLIKNGTTGWLLDNSELSAITSANATGEISVYGGLVLTVTSSAGIIRLVCAFYRDINRSATGNIVDQSPWLGDAPWHVEKWTWQAALANSQVAVRGVPLDAGSGQVLLEVTLDVLGQEAVEALPAAGGANPITFDPAKTPRMITQFMWDRTGANEFVFFGLRHVPGDVMPAGGGAEHCAGFCYDSVIGFFTRTDDGGASEDTVFAAPGHGVPIQLEIIIFGGVRVEFYMDGVLVATHTTNIPTDTLYWQHLLYTDGGAGLSTEVDVEIRNGGVQECPV